MRGLLLTLMGVAVFTFGIAQPKMKFENTEVDLGDVVNNESVTYKFHFTNSGSETLEIELPASLNPNVRWTRDKWKIEPGDSSFIFVSVLTKDNSGSISSKVKVKTNEPKGENKHTLELKVNLIPYSEE